MRDRPVVSAPTDETARERKLTLASGRRFVVVSRAVPNAAARFDGPFNEARAWAELEWWRMTHPAGRASVFELVARREARNDG